MTTVNGEASTSITTSLRCLEPTSAAKCNHSLWMLMPLFCHTHMKENVSDCVVNRILQFADTRQKLWVTQGSTQQVTTETYLKSTWDVICIDLQRHILVRLRLVTVKTTSYNCFKELVNNDQIRILCQLLTCHVDMRFYLQTKIWI